MMKQPKTLQDLIDDVDRYDINKITYFTMTDDETLIIPDTNVMEIYRRYINPYVVKYRVTDRQREYYRYKPYLLSTDVYGTPKLADMILMLNDRECASKFTIKSTIKLIPYEILGDLYESIVTRSTAKLEENWANYLNKITTP